MLNDAICRSATCPAGSRNKKYYDQNGLYLVVGPTSRVWRFDYQRNNTRRTLTLGTYPQTSLSRARALAQGHRSNLRTTPDYDPVLANQQKRLNAQQAAQQARQAQQAQELFEESAELFFQRKRRDWQQMPDVLRTAWLAGDVPAGQRATRTTEHRNRNRVRRHLLPALGHLPTSSLDAQQLANVVNAIQAPSEREKILELLRGIMRSWHRRNRHLPDPAYALDEYLTFEKHIQLNHAAILEPAAFGLMIRDVQVHGGLSRLNPTACLFTAQVYLWQRGGALRLMRWENVDFENQIWNCPIVDMKISTDGKNKSRKQIERGISDGYYQIPLPNQLIVLLTNLHRDRGQPATGYVFSTTGDKPLSDNTARKMIISAGYGGKQTFHGFRASAQTILSENFEVNQRVVDSQLGHNVDKLRQAYQRAGFLHKRRRLVQGWSDLVDWLIEGKPIEKFNSKYLSKTLDDDCDEIDQLA